MVKTLMTVSTCEWFQTFKSCGCGDASNRFREDPTAIRGWYTRLSDRNAFEDTIRHVGLLCRVQLLRGLHGRVMLAQLKSRPGKV